MYPGPKRSFSFPSHQTIRPAQKVFFFTWFLEGRYRPSVVENSSFRHLVPSLFPKSNLMGKTRKGRIIGHQMGWYLALAPLVSFLGKKDQSFCQFFFIFYWSNLCYSSLVSLECTWMCRNAIRCLGELNSCAFYLKFWTAKKKCILWDIAF